MRTPALSTLPSAGLDRSARPAPGVTATGIGARSVLVVLTGLIGLGIGLRFATLGLQGYHHDEVITAARVIPGGFGEMLHKVRVSESTPPLYYVLAWAWSKAFGVGEVGLRSLSALFGAATVPVGYLIGGRLLGRRGGLILAALIAVNPMLIWYSQEARAYALLVFLCSLALLFLIRTLQDGRRSDLAIWAVCAALALWTHYFAVFLIVPEAILLLVFLRRRWIAGLLAVGAVVLLAAPLLPLLSAQANPAHIGWIGGTPLPERLRDTLASFAIGETGHVIGEPTRAGLALVPGLICLSAPVFVAAFGLRRERLAFLLGLGLGVSVLALAAAAALIGSDYVTERNLLPALIPLLLAVAAGFAVVDRFRLGLLATIVLCVWCVAFDVQVTRTQSLQRLDFRAAAEVLKEPRRPARAIVTWRLGADPLRFYLHRGPGRVFGGEVRVREIDVIAKASVRESRLHLPRAFHRVATIPQGRLKVVRYRSARPVEVRVKSLLRQPTGFGVSGVLFEGPHAKGLGSR